MTNASSCALVFGGSVTALGICRNLGLNGIKVYCVNEELTEVAFSKFCTKFFKVRNIEHNLDVLSHFLEELTLLNVDEVVIFPASDLFCLAIAKLSALLPRQYFYWSNQNTVETLVDKAKFCSSLSGTDIPHPTTHVLNETNIEDIKDKINYPILIKPAVTQDFWRFNTKSIVAQNPIEFTESINPVMKQKIPVVLQEIVPGPPSNLFGVAGYIDSNYEIKGVFSYRRIRGWPPDFGCNSLIESIPIKEVGELKDSLVDYLRSIKYCGLFEAEFKHDQRDGVPKIIEINARGWWQNYFPTACGLNLVLMAYLDAIGKEVKYRETYTTGVKWIYPFNDMRAAMTLIQNGELRIFEWLYSIRHIIDYPYFNARDPLPSLSNPFFVGPVYTKELFRKLSAFKKSFLNC